MYRNQYKNKSNNSQGNISTVASSYPMIVGHKYCNIAEAHVKDLKTNYIKMIEVLKEEKNKSLNEIQEKMRKQWKK